MSSEHSVPRPPPQREQADGAPTAGARWTAWPARPLAPGEVHVWRVRARGADPADAALLAEEERARAGRFRFEDDRRRFVAARAALRRIAGAYLGTAPAALRFRIDRHGKPALEGDGPLRFNLSHSGELVLLAFARDVEVGVDVERRRSLPEGEALEATVCTGSERRGLAGLAGGARAAAFFDLWAGKEAVLKALGRGLLVSPRAVELPVPWTAAVRVAVEAGEGAPTELEARPLAVGDGSSAALAHVPGVAIAGLYDGPWTGT